MEEAREDRPAHEHVLDHALRNHKGEEDNLPDDLESADQDPKSV